MSYTINYGYNKYLDIIDKAGSDFVTVDQFMEQLLTETYNFIGETVKFLGNTEEIVNDLRALYKPFDISVTVDPNDSAYKVIVFPDDYYHLMFINIIDSGATVRVTKKFRHANYEATVNNPNKRPTAEYPSVVMYDTYVRVHSPGTPTDGKGFYITKPTFGDVDGDMEQEVLVNLPDNIVEKIFKMMGAAHYSRTGDQRYATSKNEELGFRVKGK